MIREGWLRIIEYQNNNERKANTQKKRVLFPCDLANVDVEQIAADPKNKKCHDYVSKMWATNLTDNSMTNWEKILQD